MLAAAAACLAASGPGAALAALPERSDRVARYELDAWLDHGARSVQGKGRITWRNTSEDLILELQLHLYMNAFKNDQTTFMKESKGQHRGHGKKEGEWGWIDLLSLKLEGGGDLLSEASFIQPDDGNESDETVLRIPLREPIEPGGEITLETVFSTRLPQVFARTGYARDFYLVGQWFPKMCVYEREGVRGREVGGWNCHQFHSESEFYSDFGSYDVKVTVPSDFVVGATGRLAEPPRATAGGTTTYRFIQDDVHDFAWTADPDFVQRVRTFSYAERRDPKEETRMSRVLGLDGSRIPAAGATDLSGVPEEIRLPDVEVKLLLQPEHASQADRHFEAVFNAILYFGYWYGRYPYGTLTVVDPAFGGRGAGGMEYPTLITAGTRWLAPSWRHEPESVTVHEFGHQYWYGLVASNEFEEAWLDEGLTTYSTGRLLDKVYGPNHNVERVAGIPLNLYPFFEIPRDADPNGIAGSAARPRLRSDRILYMRWAGASNEPLLNFFRDLPILTQPSDVPNPYFQDRRHLFLRDGAKNDQILRDAWDFYERPSYSLNSYSKPAAMLDTLRSIIGADAFDRGMRLYQERFRFRHPSSADFTAVMSEAAGSDLSWYFDQLLHGADLLDYEIVVQGSTPVPPGAGAFGPPSDRKIVSLAEAKAAASKEKPLLETVVSARRIGEMKVPVEIELLFEGGRIERHEWDGDYRWFRVRTVGTEKIVQGRIGPPEPLTLEANWVNNAKTVKQNDWPAVKWWTRLVGWMQNILYFYSGIV